MAFFKSRSQTASSDDSPQDDAQSMDSLRQQARHRLIGATVLVVIAVVDAQAKSKYEIPQETRKSRWWKRKPKQA
mgnify:CR=1 FL=1